jgi:hypothetical protein
VGGVAPATPDVDVDVTLTRGIVPIKPDSPLFIGGSHQRNADPTIVGGYKDLAFDPNAPRTKAAMDEAAALRNPEGGRASVDQLNDFVNKKMFPNDTWYDLATNKTQPDFDNLMTAGGGKGFTATSDDLLAIGQADCRGRNVSLANAMARQGYENVELVAARATLNGMEENHTVVRYMQNGQVHYADAYYRQFNGSQTALEAGQRGPVGRWNQPGAADTGDFSIRFDPAKGNYVGYGRFDATPRTPTVRAPSAPAP